MQRQHIRIGKRGLQRRAISQDRVFRFTPALLDITDPLVGYGLEQGILLGRKPQVEERFPVVAQPRMDHPEFEKMQ